MLVSNSVIAVVSFFDLISEDLRAVTAFRPSALFHQFSFVHPHNNGPNLNETKAIIIFFNRQITLFPHFWQNTRGLVAKEKSRAVSTAIFIGFRILYIGSFMKKKRLKYIFQADALPKRDARSCNWRPMRPLRFARLESAVSLRPALNICMPAARLCALSAGVSLMNRQ
jgi:hypothetical protein